MFHPTANNVYSIIWGLTLPIAGWLADVYLKRYKVIRWSIMIMWIASVLVAASSVLSQLPVVEHYYHNSAKKYVTINVAAYCNVSCLWRLPSQCCPLWN